MYICATLASAPAMKNLLGRITYRHTKTFRNETVLSGFSELFLLSYIALHTAQWFGTEECRVSANCHWNSQKTQYFQYFRSPE